MLLESGADYMVSTEAGLNGTALHYAAGKGKLECVRWSNFFLKLSFFYSAVLYWILRLENISEIKQLTV